MTSVLKLFQKAPDRNTYGYAGVLPGMDLWDRDSLKAYTPLMDRVWTKLSAIPVDNMYNDAVLSFYQHGFLQARMMDRIDRIQKREQTNV